MRIEVVAKNPAQVRGDAIVVAFTRLSRKRALPLAKYLGASASKRVVGEPGVLTWLEGRQTAAPRVCVACFGGLASEPGWAGSPTPDQTTHQRDLRSRQLGAAVEQACHDQGITRAVIAPLPDAINLAAFVGAIVVRGHSNIEFRPDDESSSLRRVTLCVEKEALRRVRQLVADVMVVSESVNLARTLTDLPANIGTPDEIVSRVRAATQGTALKVSSDGPAKILRRKMGLLAAVMRGSEHGASLLRMEHCPPGHKGTAPLVLVGKGVIHDTGGYNLKTSNTLHRFTDDKAGAAAVIGAMRAIAALKLPIRVVGLAPLVENVIGAKAYKPGDVLTAMNGTTVFVENTDAEGRLALADCLSWAAALKPRLVVDIATLTGAAWTALGGAFSAVFANDDMAMQAVCRAGVAATEPVWPMPIHPEHAAELDHHLAYLRNAGPGEGGASVAAAFLRHFVDYPWAHVDMAGHGSSQFGNALLGPGGTGYGVRMLVELARALSLEPNTETDG